MHVSHASCGCALVTTGDRSASKIVYVGLLARVEGATAGYALNTLFAGFTATALHNVL